MPDRQRLTLARRARALGSRPAFSIRSCVKRICSAPPTTFISSRDVLIASALRPQASALVLIDVRTLLCSSVPSGIASAATGTNRGVGVFMGSILGAQPGAVHVQKSETET